MNPITLAGVSSASDAFTEFSSIATTAFNFIMNNWYLAVLLGVPLVGFIVGNVMGWFRR